MTWASIIASVLKFFNALADWIRSNRDIELGERRERERHEKSNLDTVDRIRRADPDSVSDNEAFGGRDRNLPRT